jgi:hypothetical protein
MPFDQMLVFALVLHDHMVLLQRWCNILTLVCCSTWQKTVENSSGQPDSSGHDENTSFSSLLNQW